MDTIQTKALIFDFDGLILETESPVYQAWLEVYAAHGCDLPLSKWCECVGKAHGTFDPHTYLEAQLGRALERETIRARRHARFTELMAAQKVLPGVAEYICEAKRLGLKVGLASSSPFDWISRNLSLFGMLEAFDTIKCADNVTHTKPDPAVYLAALQALEVEAVAAVAFEDSPNGLLAAKRAGIFCVAVPNAITKQLVFERADLKLASLADLPLEELLRLKEDGAIEVGSA